MQGEFLSKWLLHYDPIHRGWTPRGIANAVCATNGWCFPRVGGGYNLYRGPTAAAIDFAKPVGAAGPLSRSVANFAWQPHAPSTEYHYAIKAIGGGGVESDPSQPAVRLVFNASGGLIGRRCNSPTDLTAAPAAGGRFELRWTYSPLGEEIEPQEFRVYGDGGTGTINYAAAVGAVTFRPRAAHSSFLTGEHAHGARRRWAVRAVSIEGEQDGNTAFVESVADAVGPPAPMVIGECLQV